MHKIVYIFILYLLLPFFLYAKEPVLAILDSVDSNGLQMFHIRDYSFVCRAYGVLTLQKLYNNSKLDSKCQKEIYNLYKKNPNLKYYAQKVLKTQQTYHVEFKNRECVLYAFGEKTLSESLLENGLAVYKPIFKDDEFKYLFYNAQLKAKMGKHGMWEKNIIYKCIEELYK